MSPLPHKSSQAIQYIDLLSPAPREQVPSPLSGVACTDIAGRAAFCQSYSICGAGTSTRCPTNTFLQQQFNTPAERANFVQLDELDHWVTLHLAVGRDSRAKWAQCKCCCFITVAETLMLCRVRAGATMTQVRACTHTSWFKPGCDDAVYQGDQGPPSPPPRN